MKKEDYTRKTQDLLSDQATYRKVNAGFTKQEAVKFKEVRKILTRTEREKRMIGLLEKNPKSARMKGLPKIHKTGFPMRSITSGIGSAPHRLAKILAKPLSGLLGSIS